MTSLQSDFHPIMMSKSLLNDVEDRFFADLAPGSLRAGPFAVARLRGESARLKFPGCEILLWE
jgi:hypothetical protein